MSESTNGGPQYPCTKQELIAAMKDDLAAIARAVATARANLEKSGGSCAARYQILGVDIRYSDYDRRGPGEPGCITVMLPQSDPDGTVVPSEPATVTDSILEFDPGTGDLATHTVSVSTRGFPHRSGLDSLRTARASSDIDCCAPRWELRIAVYPGGVQIPYCVKNRYC